MLKHVNLVIELIQQRRQFICDTGPVIIYSDNLGAKICKNKYNIELDKKYAKTKSITDFLFDISAVEDDPMLKLSKFLIEKRLRLIDMFRILDKKQMLRMEKEEFMKRLKVL
jgi:hypothetical protein